MTAFDWATGPSVKTCCWRCLVLSCD